MRFRRADFCLHPLVKKHQLSGIVRAERIELDAQITNKKIKNQKKSWTFFPKVGFISIGLLLKAERDQGYYVDGSFCFPMSRGCEHRLSSGINLMPIFSLLAVSYRREEYSNQLRCVDNEINSSLSNSALAICRRSVSFGNECF